MDNVNNILKKRLRHYGLDRIADSSFVCQKSDEVSGGKFKAISFKNHVLTIQVDNSSIACQLQLEQKQILDKINSSLGEQAINRIKFRVG